MKKGLKFGYGVLALAVGLALPTTVWANSLDDSKAEEVLKAATEVENEVVESQATEAEATVSEPEVEAPKEEAKVEEKTEEVVPPAEEKAVLKAEQAPTVTANATPLATAKPNVKVEVNAATTPGYFVTVENETSVTFKSKPDVSSIGNKSVVIVATDGVTTEEITVPYVVTDTQKPTIEVWDTENIVGLNEPDWYAEDFVSVDDNSDDYEVFFANGRETLDTSKVGTFNTVIVARDAAGNEASVTLTYEVVDFDSEFDEYYDYEAPTIDKAKSNASVVYGKTRPNTLVAAISETSDMPVGYVFADDNGQFELHLKNALKNGETVYIMSMDLFTGESSDIAEYTYSGEKVMVNQVSKNNQTPVKTATKVASTTEKDPEVSALPKTGDSPGAEGLVAIGALATLLATVYLRKRS
ncbi:LPXTG cell wall anchor domain-containing protein [Listeria fleischmannii]|uniref:Cell wall anchor domain-containing protein n=1 Tax=Listeria fleischmannii FSL S10-1203 TaxID=1265822 RepID=W7DP44_9LIST|nr:LPXTG cell wall anchor domain-containing protein [Listeria fleischmannii]EUJ51543.1 cell wall anchor domain-containing protein [Listeria fleischmannii FSL S10-1203]